MVGNLVVLLLVIGMIWILIRQFKHTVRILDNKRSLADRTFLFNSLCTISLAGFLVSYILNFLISLQNIETAFLTANNTANSCTLFILAAVISKSLAITGNAKQNHKLNRR
ncbi:hypothetical protein [Paraliobacillus zengyii]|uniref:hypothetical protein n=1 Tax=Paraliobacillus zengyii TaxID=2213194 RepID=UPI000DD45627|nr:hypothetical protein [Paraliobacillus zengyii]